MPTLEELISGLEKDTGWAVTAVSLTIGGLNNFVSDLGCEPTRIKACKTILESILGKLIEVRRSTKELRRKITEEKGVGS